jgi:hypothetical protein
MSAQLRRRTVYAATVAAMISVVAGFALASFTISPHGQGAQGDQVSASGVTGLTYASTILQPVSGSPASSTGTAGVPQTLASGPNTFCVSVAACATGDPSETVTYSFATSLVGSIQMTIAVNAGNAGGQTTLYLAQPTTATSGTIVMVWDLGTAGATVNGVTITAQSCTGAGGSCP